MKSMKQKYVWVGVVLALSIGAVAQKVKTFESESGQMTLSSISWAAKELKDGKIQFVATGKPVVGNWVPQKMSIQCLKILGIASPGDGGALVLASATMTGDVVATATRLSQNKSSNIPQTIVLNSNEATYDAALSLLKCIGNVKIVNEDKGDKRQMTLSGNSAEVTLLKSTKANEQGIRSAVVSGNVGFVIKGYRVVRDKATKAQKEVAVSIDGKADKLTYNSEDRTLTMIGNVSINGADPIFGANTDNLNNATIKFDENMKPVEVEMNGDPARTTVSGKAGGKG